MQAKCTETFVFLESGATLMDFTRRTEAFTSFNLILMRPLASTLQDLLFPLPHRIGTRFLFMPSYYVHVLGRSIELWNIMRII